MTRDLEKRLARLEDALIPPRPPVSILLLAEDDPDKDRLMAEHEERLIATCGTADLPFPTVIILTPGQREDTE